MNMLVAPTGFYPPNPCLIPRTKPKRNQKTPIAIKNSKYPNSRMSKLFQRVWTNFSRKK